jgi:D-alanyl-D-alanine carboxypeptidase (penicillin-binding protein 5/6)
MASTTKIMTAVVVLENAELDDLVTVDRVASKVGESAMNIRPGEQFTVGDLLAGVLVQSGNDAATMLANHVGGSVPAFVEMMNAKAKSLDMVNTHFKNPHGLDVPGHYTSAEDLTAISRYAMRFPEFRRLAGTYTMKVRSDLYTHTLKSHNALLKTYKGAEGIKTGWTDEAGYCVVFAAKRGEIEFVGCVLGAGTEGGRAAQAKRLLDWGFAHYKTTSVVATDEPVGRVRISDYVERTAPAVTAEATSMPVFDLAGPVGRRIELKPSIGAPVKRGDNLGTMTIYQGDMILAQVPVVSAADIPSPTVWQRIGFFFIRTWRGIVGT